MTTETRNWPQEEGSMIPEDFVGDSAEVFEQVLGGPSEEVSVDEALEAGLGGVASVITNPQVTTIPIKGMTMKITIKNTDFIIEQVPGTCSI